MNYWKLWKLWASRFHLQLASLEIDLNVEGGATQARTGLK